MAARQAASSYGSTANETLWRRKCAMVSSKSFTSKTNCAPSPEGLRKGSFPMAKVCGPTSYSTQKSVRNIQHQAGLQSENVLVERAGSSEVGDWIHDKGEFDDFHARRILPDEVAGSMGLSCQIGRQGYFWKIVPTNSPVAGWRCRQGTHRVSAVLLLALLA